jgi:hypothetical protein
LDESARKDGTPLSLKRLLVPTAKDLLVVQPASPLVNNVRNEGPQLLAGCKIDQQLLFNFYNRINFLAFCSKSSNAGFRPWKATPILIFALRSFILFNIDRCLGGGG